MQFFSLNSLAVDQLAAARSAPNGRSAQTLHVDESGSDDPAVLRRTVLALIAGQGLSDHESPGEATLLVLRGRVQVATANESWDGSAGDLLVIPAQRHDLRAVDDSVVLLTVLPRAARS